ncbi:hypothetical protein JCM11251_006212 [Rhodosporidiobolus azoricus]
MPQSLLRQTGGLFHSRELRNQLYWLFLWAGSVTLAAQQSKRQVFLKRQRADAEDKFPFSPPALIEIKERRVFWLKKARQDDFSSVTELVERPAKKVRAALRTLESQPWLEEVEATRVLLEDQLRQFASDGGAGPSTGPSTLYGVTSRRASSASYKILLDILQRHPGRSYTRCLQRLYGTARGLAHHKRRFPDEPAPFLAGRAAASLDLLVISCQRDRLLDLREDAIKNYARKIKHPERKRLLNPVRRNGYKKTMEEAKGFEE